MPIEVISLLSDEESTIPPPRKRRRTQSSPTDLVSSTDDEIVIVSHNKRGAKDLTPATQPAQTKAEDEIECVGEQRGVDVLVDYPHFRFQCAKLAWPSLARRGPKRPRFCPRCFCYVCDIPAAECQKWSSHEHAHDGNSAWRSKRREKVERRKRVEIGNEPTHQSCAPFTNSLSTPTRSLYNLQALRVSTIRKRRKAKSKRSGGEKKRGRPR